MKQIWVREPVRILYGAAVAALVAVAAVLEGGWPGWAAVWQAALVAVAGEVGRYFVTPVSDPRDRTGRSLR